MKHTRPGPFAVLVRDLVGRPGHMREASFDVALAERWGEGIVNVPAAEPVHVEVRLESVHEGILASGSVDTRYVGECSRCLRPISGGVEVEFQQLFAYPDTEASELQVLDDHVDLETEVRDAIVLSLPFQPVCRPDCPGLDSVTGARLEDMPDATPRRITDPRWAALAGFAAEPAQDPQRPGARAQDQEPKEHHHGR